MRLCIVLSFDMTDLGIIAVTDVWRNREMERLRRCNEEFRKLSVEEQKIMVAAIRDDDQLAMDSRRRT
jgi:hypothetical protein